MDNLFFLDYCKFLNPCYRDISRKEVILNETPYVYGPSREKGLVCLGCLKPVKTFSPCPSCSLPLCSPSCGARTNHEPECRFLSRRRLRTSPENENLQRIMDLVLPIRYLLKTKYSEQKSYIR